jgi:lysophospholipid acyltransferase (LPLAT)-like uncharacterized protein
MAVKPNRKKKKRAGGRKLSAEIKIAVLSWLILPLITSAARSWRITKDFHPETARLLEDGKPVIFAIWHGRMYSILRGLPAESTALLISPSNDGEMIARFARQFGFRHMVRGSHKRGGAQALRQLMNELHEHQRSIMITVDGPRGPRYTIKPGVIRLAAQTGIPIVPLASASGTLLGKVTSAWDHFHLPWFFSKMRYIYGEPFYVAADSKDEPAIELARQDLQHRLRQLTQDADAVYNQVEAFPEDAAADKPALVVR